MTAPYGVDGSNVRLWVKADSFLSPSTGATVGMVKVTSGGGTTPADGTRVQLWHDLSGEDNDMTQPVNSRRPEFYANVLNGLPALLFDSNRNCLMASASTGTHQPVTTAIDNFTMFVVADPDVPDTTTAFDSGLIPFFNGDGASGGYGAWRNDAGKWAILRGGIAWHPSGTNADTNRHVVALRRASGAMNMYVDGGTAMVSTGSAPSSPAGSHTRLGSHSDAFAAGQFNGYIGEAILWNAALSDADMNTVGNALERWGTTWTNI